METKNEVELIQISRIEKHLSHESVWHIAYEFGYLLKSSIRTMSHLFEQFY